MTTWTRAVARAFDRAEDYEAAATIQAIVAARLAAEIARHPLPAEASVLEVGCGTGLLTNLLRRHAGTLVACDLAPGMAARTRTRFAGDPGLHVMVMDGERPALVPGFDLVAASLAAQWFMDLPGSLERLAGLLAPGGLLAVTTLGAETFREWRTAHAALGYEAATPSYPASGALRRLAFPGRDCEVRVETIVEDHADGHAFLRALRAIGALTPGRGRPLSAGALRRVLRRFDEAGPRATYEVVTLLVRRSR